MSSDEKVIKMIIRNQPIEFVIVIPMLKNAFYAGCFKQSIRIAAVSMKSSMEMKM